MRHVIWTAVVAIMVSGCSGCVVPPPDGAGGVTDDDEGWTYGDAYALDGEHGISLISTSEWTLVRLPRTLAPELRASGLDHLLAQVEDCRAWSCGRRIPAKDLAGAGADADRGDPKLDAIRIDDDIEALLVTRDDADRPELRAFEDGDVVGV